MSKNRFSQSNDGFIQTRAPWFDGSNYGFWKYRMMVHLEGIDFDLWDIVNNKFLEIKAKRSDWSASEKKLMQLNANAINIFYCSLAEDEFNCISNCATVNEIWTTLEVTHEGKDWNEWYLDSGCSHHMTGDATLFSEIKYKLGGKVTFGGNGKG
ncbi:hypothetical protein LINGRAHAP2_LOCUS24178, partial [Linum grandiflorum]